MEGKKEVACSVQIGNYETLDINELMSFYELEKWKSLATSRLP